MITVYLADKQVLFREGIHFTLSGEEDLEVVGETTSNEEALNFIETNSPNIAILNNSFCQPSAVEITHRLKQNLSPVATILVMESDDDEQALAAMKCGASASITKDIDPDNLLKIIREVAKGGRPITQNLLKPALAVRILEDFEAIALLGQQINYTLAHLNQREGDALRRIAEGETAEQIVTAMGINRETLEIHLIAILNKLVDNERSRNLIEAVQNSLPPTARRPGEKPVVDYVTRDEFLAFRDSLKERLGTLFG